MKKLSIICAIVLALGVMAPQVYAQTVYGVDVGADGKPPFDPAGPPTGTISPNGTVDIDIWLSQVPEPMLGVGFQALYTSTDMSVSIDMYDNGVAVDPPYDSLAGLLPGDWSGGGGTVVAPLGPGAFFASLGDIVAVSSDGDGDIAIAKLSITDLTGTAGTITLNLTATGVQPYNGGPSGNIDASIADVLISLDVICACTADVDCDDGLWCTGVETCNTAACECIAGTPPCLDNLCEEEVCTEGAPGSCATETTCKTPPSGPSDECCDELYPVCNEAGACGGVGVIVVPSYYIGTVGIKVDLCLDNQAFEVGGLQMDVCDEPDCLECVGCELSERTVLFDCFVNDSPPGAEGCCRVILISKNPGGVINPGLCNIVKIDYQQNGNPDCDVCIELTVSGVASDPYGRPLDLAGTAGTICPIVCGDVHPAESAPAADDCGDEDVDLMDIMTEVDIALGAVIADACQAPRADVPTGTPGRVPTDCGGPADVDGCCPPDGVVNILDIMVLIDMALSRQDCCSYYYQGIIY